MSPRKDPKNARSRDRDLLVVAGIFAVVALIASSAVLSAPMVESETCRSQDDGYTVTVHDPPAGAITVSRGGTQLVPTLGYGLSTYKAGIGDTLEFEFVPGTTGATLYRWVVDGVEVVPDEGRCTLVAEDDAAVSAVMLLEGEVETAGFIEAAFSDMMPCSDVHVWTADWGSVPFDPFPIDLGMYGYGDMALTVASGSISISGLGGATGTVHVTGVVADIGGTLYSIDVLVQIVPQITPGEVSQ